MYLIYEFYLMNGAIFTIHRHTIFLFFRIFETFYILQYTLCKLYLTYTEGIRFSGTPNIILNTTLKTKG